MKRFFVLGLIAAGAVVFGALGDRAQFFQSYLLAYLFWCGVALGSYALLLLYPLVGGGWGLGLQPFFRAAVGTLPLLAVLFIPFALGLGHLYPWARPDAVAASELLRHKAPYLNANFFLIRAAIYFSVWIGFGFTAARWSRETPVNEFPQRLQLIAGLGLLFYGLTATFSSVDWAMSLVPEWFSTIYGLLFITGQVVSGLGFCVAAAILVCERRGGLLAPEHYHDFGNLMLAFVMLWAYVALSQFLIIWSANLPEEITWYLDRFKGGWQGVGLALVAGHFALPFFLLLSRANKRRPAPLLRIAVAVVVMHVLDVFWLVVPAFHPGRIAVHWMDLAALLALGGVWCGVFAWRLKDEKLVAVAAPSGH